MISRGKEQRSQKQGLLRMPDQLELATLQSHQKAFRAIGLYAHFGAVLNEKAEDMHQNQRAMFTKKGGPTVGAAIDAALERAGLENIPILPYVTPGKRDSTRKVLRVHQVDLHTGLALPESNVKVADCDQHMSLIQLANDFTREQFLAARSSYRQLVELHLYQDVHTPTLSSH